MQLLFMGSLLVKHTHSNKSKYVLKSTPGFVAFALKLCYLFDFFFSFFFLYFQKPVNNSKHGFCGYWCSYLHGR